MTTIGIHQPYFFPYLGYFQLINAVDVWVCLEHVSFMKRSYMTRNTLKDGININIPVIGGSQNKRCTEVYVEKNRIWFEKFARTLDLNYKNEKNFIQVTNEVLAPWYNDVITHPRELTISEFNFTAIYRISEYLGIETRFYSSNGITEAKREKGLQDIVKSFHGDTYINAIGGQALYNKENFSEAGIDLKFLKKTSELPNTSILDILFKYDKEVIKQELNKFELI